MKIRTGLSNTLLSGLSGAVLAGLAFAGSAQAAPILYEGALSIGETVFGQIGPSPEGDWWSFDAAAGQTLVLTGHRLEAALDPGFELYFGFGDTDDLLALGSADDSIPPFPGLEGPFLDPQLAFLAPFTGTYSVFFTSIISADPGPDGVYEYQLSLALAEVPESAAITLLGAGLLGAGLARRRQRRA